MMDYNCSQIVGMLTATTRILEWAEDASNHEANHVITKTDAELEWCQNVESDMRRIKAMIYALIQQAHAIEEHQK